MALKYLYVPSGYKAGTAYGVLPNVANADLAFVRGSSATRINADGLIETMATNVPRLDYTDGSCPTLLTEPESTNLLEYSEDFSQWDKISGGSGINPVISTGFSAPDGTQGASRVVFDLNGGTTTSDFSRVRDTITATTPTLSIFIKSNDTNTHQLNLSYGGGEVGLVTAAPDEWSRVEVQTTPTGAFDFRLELRGSITSDDVADVLIWGAQAENKDYATSYIPTNGATETRSADTGVISGDLSSYLNSSEGVLEIKAKSIVGNPAQDLRITLSDGTADNRISLVWGTGSSTMTIVMDANGSDVFDGGTSGFKNLTGSFTKTNMNTFKIKWKSGDIQVKHNDSTIVLSETDTFTMLGLDKLSFDNATGIRNFEGNVQYIKVYDSATDF